MGVALGRDHFASDLLLACFDVSNPFVSQHIVQGRTVLHIDFEHAADDIAAFAGEESKKPPRPLDHFLALSSRLRRSGREWGCLFASGSGRFVIAIGLVVTIVVGADRLLLDRTLRVTIFFLIGRRRRLDRRTRRSLHFHRLVTDIRHELRTFVLLGGRCEIRG